MFLTPDIQVPQPKLAPATPIPTTTFEVDNQFLVPTPTPINVLYSIGVAAPMLL